MYAPHCLSAKLVVPRAERFALLHLAAHGDIGCRSNMSTAEILQMQQQASVPLSQPGKLTPCWNGGLEGGNYPVRHGLVHCVQRQK